MNSLILKCSFTFCVLFISFAFVGQIMPQKNIKKDSSLDKKLEKATQQNNSLKQTLDKKAEYTLQNVNSIVTEVPKIIKIVKNNTRPIYVIKKIHDTVFVIPKEKADSMDDREDPNNYFTYEDLKLKPCPPKDTIFIKPQNFFKRLFGHKK